MREARSPSTAQVALLMTRPAAASRRFVGALSADLLAKIEVIHAPLLQIIPVEADIDAQAWRGVIFTSANGVAAAGAAERALPAYCVGARTTQAAAKAGWMAEQSGTNAEELLTALIAKHPATPLLHLHGTHTRGDVAARLTAAALPCSSKVIYDQALLPLPADTRRAICAQSQVIVPLFSPRTARHFASLGLDPANLTLIALSEAVAVELKDLNCKDLRVSKTADAFGMAAMVRDAAVRLAHLEGGNPAQ